MLRTTPYFRSDKVQNTNTPYPINCYNPRWLKQGCVLGWDFFCKQIFCQDICNFHS